jgi:hypothetical protein
MTRVCSIFSQILQFFPRHEFQAAVQTHQAERHARGFSCWTQFVAMLFSQLGHAQTLREITGGLADCEGKLRHLGIEKPPKRSTLAYANEHRPWELFQTVFQRHYQYCSVELLVRVKKRFRLQHKLLTLDATLVPPCLAVFDWAKYRRTKGAVKLRLILDHDGFLPQFAVLTPGKIHEIEVARRRNQTLGSDKGLRTTLKPAGVGPS